MKLKLDRIRELSLRYAQRAIPLGVEVDYSRWDVLPPDKPKKKRKRKHRPRRAAKPSKPVKPKKLTSKERYAIYLQSPHWKEFRAMILVQRGRKCELCGRRKFIQVHHLTYARKGKELPSDVQVVCRPCHEGIHGI